MKIIKIIKALCTKDSPEESKRPWVFRRRFIGIAVLIGSGSLAAKYGVILDGSATDILTSNLQVIIATVSAFISTPWDFSHIDDKISNLQAVLAALGAIYGTLKHAQGWITRQIPVSSQGQAVTSPPQPVPPLPQKIHTCQWGGCTDRDGNRYCALCGKQMEGKVETPSDFMDATDPAGVGKRTD